MSAMGEVVITCSGEEGIHMWDLHSGQHLMTYRNNSSSKSGVWDSIGTTHMLAVQQKRSAIHIWTWSKESPLHRFTPPERLEALAVSNDGLYCVGGGQSGKLYLWQISTGRLLNSWDGHYKAVTALKWTDNDAFLLSAGEDALLNLWSLSIIFGGAERDKVRPEVTWNDHSLPITAIYCGSGGINGRVLTVAKDQTCRVWDISTKKMVASLKFPSSLTAVTMDPMERFLLVGGLDGRIFFVDMSVTNQDSPFSPFAHHQAGASEPFRGIGIGSAQKKQTATTTTPKSALDAMMLDDTSAQHTQAGGDYQNVLIGHDQSISSLSISREGNLLVSGSLDGTALVWDLYSGQVIKTYNRLKGPITNVKVIPRPQHLYLVDEVGGDGKATGVEPGAVTTGGAATALAAQKAGDKAKLPSVKPFRNFVHRNVSVYDYEPMTGIEQQQQQGNASNNNNNNNNKKKQMKTATEKNEERRMEEILASACVPIQLKSLGGERLQHYSESSTFGGSTLGDLPFHLAGADIAADFMSEQTILHHMDKHLKDLEGGTGVEAATIRENRRLQGEIAMLHEEGENWKKLNNELYQFCVHQLVQDSVLTTTVKESRPTTTTATTPNKKRKNK